MINNKTHLSNIDWIFKNDGSFVIPVITEFDIIKRQRTIDIGLGMFDKKIPTQVLENLSSENFLQRERTIIELVANLKNCPLEDLTFCSSEKMLFSIINLPFDSKNPIIEGARECEKEYTLALMSEFHLPSAECLDSPPRQLRGSITFKKHLFQKDFTDKMKLDPQRIEDLSAFIQNQLQHQLSQQETPEA